MINLFRMHFVFVCHLCAGLFVSIACAVYCIIIGSLFAGECVPIYIVYVSMCWFVAVRRSYALFVVSVCRLTLFCSHAFFCFFFCVCVFFCCCCV